MARINTIGRYLEENLRAGTDEYIAGRSLIQPLFLNYIDMSIGYSASYRTDLSSGSSLDVLFNNPEGSGVEAYIITVECGGFVQGLIDIFEDVTIVSNGTPVYIRSLNFAADNSPNCVVEANGTYDTSGARKVHETVLPGGVKIMAVGSIAEVGESVIIPEGRNLLIRITNNSNSSSTYSIRFLWWEKQL